MGECLNLPDPGTGPRYWAFVVELASRIDVWQRMLTEHVPTEEGFYAARECGRGGYGTPHVLWPCSTRSLADRAAAAHGHTINSHQIHPDDAEKFGRRYEAAKKSREEAPLPTSTQDREDQ